MKVKVKKTTIYLLTLTEDELRAVQRGLSRQQDVDTEEQKDLARDMWARLDREILKR